MVKKKKSKKVKKMPEFSTGKSFNLSTTLDHNPFMVSTLPDGKPKQPDAVAFSKEIIFDPVLGRQIFVQQTPMGPIATVPTVLPSQLGLGVEIIGFHIRKLRT